MSTLHTYLPQDRLRALAHGTALPDRTTGAVLFADISGFTPLTEALRTALGPRRGAEALTHYLDAVYTALIAAIERYAGSVIGFSGDALLCWFDDAHGSASARATVCALALQTAMQEFSTLALPNAATAPDPLDTPDTPGTPAAAGRAAAGWAPVGNAIALAVKVAVASGPTRRLVVGDPAIQQLDVLAGATVARTASAEHLAQKGEVLLDEATVAALGASVHVSAWRTDPDTHARFAVVTHCADVPAVAPLDHPTLEAAAVQAWVPQPVYAREQAGQGAFLTEFRPCVTLFVRFSGIDYEAPAAETQLDAFTRRAQTLAQRYAGTLIDVTIGDKGSYVYLNLGALSTHEDDARRAIKLALELHEAARTLGFLAPLQMGIAQGTLRVGAYGGPTRRTYGALGDDVNLTARLMQAAAPGTVLVSARVAKLVARDFVLEPQPPLKVKGKAEPLTVFTATGTRKQRALRLQEPNYALPMVGRQQELQLIHEKLALAAQGHAQIIGLVAEAGLGKSRLVAETIRHAQDQGFVCYGGGCQSDASNTPYHAWKSIWSAFFNADPTLALEQQIQLLTNELAEYTPARVHALPLLGILLNLAIPENDFTRTLEPQYRQSVLHAMLEECLRAATFGADDHARGTAPWRAPLLIILEDLHWMDALSHDLLDQLARALTDYAICFVLAYRPPQLQRLQAPRLEALPHFTKIALHELNTAEATQAIHAKLAQLYPTDDASRGAVPAQLVEKLMARAQGNPFFLEELLNLLHDRSLDPRAAPGLENIELPDSLHTLILSRIDQLSEREKTTLRVASIIGRLFRADWLTGYYPALGDLPQVKHDLEQLAQLDITPLDTPEPELAYLFKHIVTHEVTYESLPFATRARLHASLAEYLETQIARGLLREAPLLDTLVYHYTHSENQAKQRTYLRKAGQAALDVSAFATAVEYLTRLLTLLPDSDPTRFTIALQLAETHYHLGDYPGARTTIQTAQARATTDAERAAALALLGLITSELGDYHAAQALLFEAVPLARTSGDALTLCRALHALGDAHWRLGQLDAARAAQTESLALARTLGTVTNELYALNRLGLIALQQDLTEAARIFTEVHTRAIATGNRERAMLALNNLGVVAYARHDVALMQDNFQRALTLAREIGAQQTVAALLCNLARVDTQLGRLDAARAKVHEGLTLALRLGTQPWVVAAVAIYGSIALTAGQTERALALIGLARLQPAWSSDFQRELDAAFARWGFDPATVAAGLAQGAELDWDTTVQALLQRDGD